MIDLWTWQLSCGYHQFLLLCISKNNIFIFFSDFQLISKIKHSSMVVLMKCSCSNTRGYKFWLAVSVSWNKSSNCNKFRQNVLPFHKQWKIWMPSVLSLLMLWRPNLVRNWSIFYCTKWYLHDVDTVIIWVAMSRWTIRSYPYPQNNGIPEVVTIFWYNKKQTTILLLPMELILAQSLYSLKVIFSMIYLSFLIYPYAVHSPVPHLLIRSLYWWAYTGGSHDDKLFFNHSAQCLSLFKLFTTMQCLPIPPCLLFKSYVF